LKLNYSLSSEQEIPPRDGTGSLALYLDGEKGGKMEVRSSCERTELGLCPILQWQKEGQSTWVEGISKKIWNKMTCPIGF